MITTLVSAEQLANKVLKDIEMREGKIIFNKKLISCISLFNI